MITIYGTAASPYVRKVLVFAAEKGVAIDHQPGAFGRPTPEFIAASPFHKIPALKDGDFTLSDSTAIVAYIDALHPEPNLIPTEPRARAKTVWFEEYVDTLLTPAGAKIMFNRVVGPLMGMPHDPALADKAEAEDLPPMIDYLERILPEGRDGWLVEDRFTLADLCAASPFATLSNYARWTMDAERHPKTSAYVARVLARPAFTGVLERERAEVSARRRLDPA